MITGAAKVDILRRAGPIGQFLEDRTDNTCVFYGVTPKQSTLTSEGKWQIWRIENVDGVLQTLFANDAKYNVVWDDRATYFPPCAGTEPVFPPSSIEGNVDVSFQGAQNDATITEITVSDAGWTLLTNLPLGQAVNIQNPIGSGGDVRVNWVSPSQPGPLLPATTAGMLIREDQERFYALQTGSTTIQLYGRAVSGSRTLNVEQLG